MSRFYECSICVGFGSSAIQNHGFRDCPARWVKSKPYATANICWPEPDFAPRRHSSGLDLELTPSASVHFDDESQSAVVGAILRIGDDLREGANFDKNTWYFFAGADAEALTYRPNSPTRLTRGNFNLQDRIIVGDAQAGLGYRIGDADLSLAYIRREVSGFNNNDVSDDISFTEDAAALSFTWRR